MIRSARKKKGPTLTARILGDACFLSFDMTTIYEKEQASKFGN